MASNTYGYQDLVLYVIPFAASRYADPQQVSTDMLEGWANEFAADYKVSLEDAWRRQLQSDFSYLSKQGWDTLHRLRGNPDKLIETVLGMLR